MGTVMSFGEGYNGALGLPSLGMGKGAKAYEPTTIPFLPSDIVSIHAGYLHSLTLTSQGHLWAWGDNVHGELGRGLTDCVSGAVGDDGSVWVWGKSIRGQLGLGKHITEAIVPTRVEALFGENVAKIHLLILTQNL